MADKNTKHSTTHLIPYWFKEGNRAGNGAPRGWIKIRNIMMEQGLWDAPDAFRKKAIDVWPERSLEINRMSNIELAMLNVQFKALAGDKDSLQLILQYTEGRPIEQERDDNKAQTTITIDIIDDGQQPGEQIKADENSDNGQVLQ